MGIPAAETAWLQRHLGSPGADPGLVGARVRREPERISTLLRGLAADTAPVRFGCSKVLRVLSETSPELLYSHFDLFAKQLESKNSFLRWDGARIVANLARVDEEGKVERLLDRYLAVIAGPQMIAAATAMTGAATIALAKPHLAGRITDAILSVERASYDTEECRNVAIGHAIQALDRMFELIEDRDRVLEFAQAQLGNRRGATRQKAERFVKKRFRTSASDRG